MNATAETTCPQYRMALSVPVLCESHVRSEPQRLAVRHDAGSPVAEWAFEQRAGAARVAALRRRIDALRRLAARLEGCGDEEEC